MVVLPISPSIVADRLALVAGRRLSVPTNITPKLALQSSLI
jgi:hypothetical protein